MQVDLERLGQRGLVGHAPRFDADRHDVAVAGQHLAAGAEDGARGAQVSVRSNTSWGPSRGWITARLHTIEGPPFTATQLERARVGPGADAGDDVLGGERRHHLAVAAIDAIEVVAGRG